MNLNELYAEVAKVADTSGTKINAADTARVCASLFAVLADYPTEKVLGYVAKAIDRAKKKVGE